MFFIGRFRTPESSRWIDAILDFSFCIRGNYLKESKSNPTPQAREFLHIASLILFFWNLHSAIYRIRAYFSNYSSIERIFDYKITFSGRRSLPN